MYVKTSFYKVFVLFCCSVFLFCFLCVRVLMYFVSSCCHFFFFFIVLFIVLCVVCLCVCVCACTQ